MAITRLIINESSSTQKQTASDNLERFKRYLTAIQKQLETDSQTTPLVKYECGPVTFLVRKGPGETKQEVIINPITLKQETKRNSLWWVDCLNMISDELDGLHDEFNSNKIPEQKMETINNLIHMLSNMHYILNKEI